MIITHKTDVVVQVFHQRITVGRNGETYVYKALRYMLVFEYYFSTERSTNDRGPRID